MLLDRFLNDAIEVDVDAVCDGTDVVIGGIMEHIEQAGVHSGDSACSLPPFSLSPRTAGRAAPADDRRWRKALDVVGLMNVQFAIQTTRARPGRLRARSQSARVAHGAVRVEGDRPAAREDRRALHGRPVAARSRASRARSCRRYFSVKEAVFPFIKFPGVDTILGPEMKSTGEVMGVGETFAEAFLKSQLAAGIKLPGSGQGVHQRQERRQGRARSRRRASSHELGYQIVATRGTAAALSAAGVPVTPVNKVAEGRPHIVDMIKNDEIALVINTVEEKRSAIQDSYAIRRAALTDQVPTFTTLAGARAAATRHGAPARPRSVFAAVAARRR